MATRKPTLFSTESVGNVAVFRIETTTLFDERDVKRLFDELAEAIGPRSQIIVDLAQVLHMSSTALSKLVLMHRQSRIRGGQVVLCNLAPKVSEAFRTSKLDKLFEIASSLEEALAALHWSLEVRCPIAGCEGTSLSHEPSIAEQGGVQCCRSCGCRFWLAPFQLSPRGEARVAVSRFAIPTYEQEQIRAALGVIVVFDIVGRLDLFASEALVDAWRSVPQSCRALLDLRAATELSEPGLRLLKGHVGINNTSPNRIVVLVDQDRFTRTHAIISNACITTNHDEAMSALHGSLASDESPTPLMVLARKVDTTME